MARPRIGIFGALMAVGGILAWRWSQRQRVARTLLSRDLSRWEGEGGSVVMPGQPAAATMKTASDGDAASGAANGAANGAASGATNGAGHPAGTGEPWPFPRS
ncbi:hypothetical protein SAMN05192564_102169 [Paraburkholderia sartisoli]|uniref:Uncharacterized protein n=1 Tax=Paraburkholderia sartisoli TaxID=83784 RepID=A0A1H4C8B7_9BURK|nr:hypothetical protein SAMN05192564_102169 [Paraburkholderia sartisoli]